VDLSERVPITPAVKSHISDLLRDARVDSEFLRTAAATLGWPAVEAIFVTGNQPRGDNARKGVLGEVLDAALLAELFGYEVPVKKHRFKVTPGQPLPSADILALRVDNNAITEVCYVESKLRTARDNMAAAAGYRQLVACSNKDFPDIAIFVAARLYDRNDGLLQPFLNYLGGRDDTRNQETYLVGLTWESSAWAEEVLENLEEEAENTDLDLRVHVLKIGQLAQLTSEVFSNIGVDSLSDAD
jgi:hypothetical protein